MEKSTNLSNSPLGRNQGLKLAKVSDVKDGKGIIVNLPGGREVALFKVGNQFYALDNACPHMGGPLGDGEVEECVVTCPWHGWQFDLKTGACINMPGEDAASLPIEVRGDEIYLLP